jgi:hypothetical protein
MNQDKSYIGAGNILIREYGSAAPLVEIGNCSKLTLTHGESVKKLRNFRRTGGGTNKEVRRLEDIEMNYAFHDFTPENFARALRSDTTAIVAGTSTDEELVAYKGGYTSAAKIINAITSVKSIGGVTTYDVGDDYELRDGMLYIPAGSAIVDPVAGAANVEITYTYLAQSRVEAFTNTAKDYEIVFMGLNEAQSGKRSRITCRKVSGGVLKEMSAIGEEFGVGDVSGALQADNTITDPDESPYYKIEMED